MLRFFLALALAIASPCATLLAQSHWEDLSPIQVMAWPKNYFSSGVHYSGRVTATFGKLGTIASANTSGDTTSAMTRTYDDGNVSADTRTDANGGRMIDDGRTNSWSYSFASQVTSDESGISFHSYSAQSDGASLDASNGSTAGVDIEFARRLASFGRSKLYQEQPFGWGILFGVSVNDVRAKTTGTIQATLHTLTDTYSLLGAAVPAAGYSAPSSNTSGSASIDTTTYIANRPDSRVETDQAGAATVKGSWDVHGAYYTWRMGNWFRWQPNPKLSLRLDAGASVTLLGVATRYYESLDLTDISESTVTISTTDDSKYYTYAIPGLYSAFDFEWWFTRRTGVFGSITYEKYSRQINLPIEERDVKLQVTSGIGIRMGITTRF